MAFLGRQQDDNDEDERGGETFALTLDDLVCPTCGRDLPPWADVCPDDGASPVPRAETTDRTPDIPAHLLDGLEDQPAPGEVDADDGQGPAPIAHDDEEGDDTAS